MTQPPAAPTLHPKRCETCNKYSERPHPAYEGNIICFCGDERTQIETKNITAKYGCCSHSSTPDADARQHGVAQISNYIYVRDIAIAKGMSFYELIDLIVDDLKARQGIEDVVKELKRLNRLYEEDFNGRVDCPQKYESQGIALMACRAIALLKDGVGRK